MMPATAWSLSLTPNAQLGVSKSSALTERWSVWARRSDGRLMERRDDPSVGHIWYDHVHSAQGLAGPGTMGVTAMGWTAGGVAQQRVYWLSAGVVAELIPGTTPASDAWTQFALPPGKTLTGHLAATWGYENGVRYSWVFATMTNGDLQVVRINGTSGLWLSLEAGVSTTTPIAASNHPSGDYIRVFAKKGNGIWMERHVLNSANWTGVSVGQPGGTGGTPVCGTLAAAEGTINQTYRIYLFCTRSGATSDLLHVASGEGAADNTFD